MIAVPSDPGEALHQRLTALDRRRHMVRHAARLLNGLTLLILCSLLLVLVDAAFSLPAAARWAVLGAWPAWSGWLGWRLIADRRNASLRPAETARAIERAHGLSHNPLTVAFQLRGQAHQAASPITRRLIDAAQQRGQGALVNLDRPLPALHEPIKRAAGSLWAALVLWLIVAAIQPGVVGRGVSRLALPAASIPAFSLTRWTLRVTPATVQAGGEATVVAGAGGRLPREATLVEVNASGRARERWPMRRTGPSRFTRQLVNLRQPVRFLVKGGGARTRIRTINPAPSTERPQAQSESSTTPRQQAGAINQTDSRPAGPATPRPATRPTDAGSGDVTGAAAWTRRFNELAERLTRFARKASGQAAVAARSQNADGAGGQAVNRRARRLSQRVEAITRRLQTHPPKDAAPSLISRTRQALQSSRLRRVVSKIASTGTASKLAEVERRSASSLTSRLSQAARADAARWRDLAGAWAAGVGTDTGAPGRAAGGDPARRRPAPATAGGYREQASQGHRRTWPGGYERQAVPGAYRALVSDYFNRLNREQATDEP